MFDDDGLAYQASAKTYGRFATHPVSDQREQLVDTTMKTICELVGETSLISFLDVGAALSEQPPYQQLIEAKRAKVTGFEPNKEQCDKLKKTFGAPHQFFPLFIGDGKQATFHETNWHETGSLYEPNTALLKNFQTLSDLVTPVATHSVQTTRLDDIEELGEIDYLKIDIQGGELSVLKNAPNVLSKTLIIQTEVEFVELYKGQPLFGDVDIYLRSAGFQFHTFHGVGTRTFKPMIINNNTSAGLRQWLWSDAIYVRDWMNLEKIGIDKLKKYAILSYDVVKSADLTLFLLMEIDRRENGNLARTFYEKIAAYAKDRTQGRK